MLTGTSSGSLAGQGFSKQTVTFTGQTTSAEVQACENHTAPDCYAENGYSRHYQIPYTGGTVTVGDLGTFTVNGTEVIDFLASVYDGDMMRLGVPGGTGLTFGASMPGVAYEYDFNKSLSWTGGPEGSFVDDECFNGPPSACAYFAATTGGELRLTTLFQGVNGQVTVTPDATALAPEPGALVLLGTGMLAGLGVVRKRLLP